MEAQQAERANRVFQLFVENSRHPGLNFERMAGKPDLYSIRLSRADRAILRRTEDAEGELFEVLLIGPHDIYRNLP